MSFGKIVIDAVWNKAVAVTGVDPRIKRKDKCGAWIARSAYGDHDSDFGWDIDHIHPVAKGGGDQLLNLQPLHWKNNVSKGDGPDRPSSYCVVRTG